jgi:hypothetical protein
MPLRQTHSFAWELMKKHGHVLPRSGVAEISQLIYSFRKSSIVRPDWLMIDLRVFRGRSLPGWLGITTRFFVFGLYQIS